MGQPVACEVAEPEAVLGPAHVHLRRRRVVEDHRTVHAHPHATVGVHRPGVIEGKPPRRPCLERHAELGRVEPQVEVVGHAAEAEPIVEPLFEHAQPGDRRAAAGGLRQRGGRDPARQPLAAGDAAGGHRHHPAQVEVRVLVAHRAGAGEHRALGIAVDARDPAVHAAHADVERALVRILVDPAGLPPHADDGLGVALPVHPLRRHGHFTTTRPSPPVPPSTRITPISAPASAPGALTNHSTMRLPVSARRCPSSR